MIVYHGSNVIVDKPQIILTVGRDFGAGFYTTDIKEQAIRWAQRKSKIANRSGKHTRPVLNMYEYDNKAAVSNLTTLSFDKPTMEWLELILRCRSDAAYKHNYDIITGGVADDNVGETVVAVLQGFMRKEDALEKLVFSQINNQICFNTEHSLQFLRFVDSEEL